MQKTTKTILEGKETRRNTGFQFKKSVIVEGQDPGVLSHRGVRWTSLCTHSGSVLAGLNHHTADLKWTADTSENEIKPINFRKHYSSRQRTLTDLLQSWVRSNELWLTEDWRCSVLHRQGRTRHWFRFLRMLSFNMATLMTEQHLITYRSHWEFTVSDKGMEVSADEEVEVPRQLRAWSTIALICNAVGLYLVSCWVMSSA